MVGGAVHALKIQIERLFQASRRPPSYYGLGTFQGRTNEGRTKKAPKMTASGERLIGKPGAQAFQSCSFSSRHEKEGKIGFMYSQIARECRMKTATLNHLYYLLAHSHRNPDLVIHSSECFHEKDSKMTGNVAIRRLGSLLPSYY